MLRAVIFDMDGVLVDSHAVHINSWKAFLASTGIVAADEELQVVRDGKNKEELLRHFMGNISHEQLRNYTEEKDRLYRENASALRTIPGVREFLVKLMNARIPAAVASSGSSWRVHRTLDLLGLQDFFATVLTATDVGLGKADPTIFLKTAEQLQVTCEGLLVFEDSAVAVRSARSVGMKCVGIAEGSHATTLLNAGAARVFPDFTDVSVNDLHLIFNGALEHKSDSCVVLT